MGPRNLRRKTEGPWKKMLCVKEMEAFTRHARDQWILSKQRWESTAPVCVPTSSDFTEDDDDWVPAPSLCCPPETTALHTACVKPTMSPSLLRRRYVDDFDITLRDMFPWLSSFFESCCCPEKKVDTRAVMRRRQLCHGPRVETVCLECGHVLAQRPLLPRSLEPCTSYHPGHPFGPAVDDGGASAPPESFPGYEGYAGWEVSPPTKVVKPKDPTKISLPAFDRGRTRCFRNVPGAVPVSQLTRGQAADLFDKDATGHVALPSFS